MLKKFIKGRWLPLIVIMIILALIAAIIFVMALFGWRITYAPELENDWEAISGVAAWAEVITAITSVVASFLAVWFAIQVPRKIAEQQDKIALFEKRYHLYNLLLSCQSFTLALKAAENIQDAWKIFLFVFYSDTLDNKNLNDISYVSVCYQRVIHELSLCDFLFNSEIGTGVLAIVKQMSYLLHDWFHVNDQDMFTKHKNDFIALHSDMETLTVKMKPYLNLSD